MRKTRFLNQAIEGFCRTARNSAVVNVSPAAQAQVTADVPKPEAYGLAVQMRRAAVSIPANIAG